MASFAGRRAGGQRYLVHDGDARQPRGDLPSRFVNADRLMVYLDRR